MRTCLVTGATSGIGRATAIELARRGAFVIVHGRTRAVADRARAELARAVPGATFDSVAADLRSLDEVRALASDLRARFPRLSVLVHNAGVERWERHVDARGLEESWVVNHLAPFLLTSLLLDVLASNAPARVIHVSSVVHRWGRIDWHDVSLRDGYTPERAYARSKLAALMTSLDLAERFDPAEVAFLSVAPGLVRSEFGREFRGLARLWVRTIGALFFRKPGAVAREIADLSLAAEWAGVTGAYVSRGKIERPADRALDPGDRARLAEITARDLGCEAVALERSPRPGVSWPRWMAACTFGELFGFGAAALFAFGAFATVGMDPTTPPERVGLLLWMTLAGAFEGVVLGTMQWLALRAAFRSLPARTFVGATVSVAVLGWLVGMLPSALGSGGSAEGATEPPLYFVMGAAAVMGAIAGALFGFAQWLALRRHAHSASRWIGANALGWALGLPWSFLAGALGDVGGSLPLAVAIAVGGGVLMGASVALATGRALSRIEPVRSLDRARGHALQSG